MDPNEPAIEAVGLVKRFGEVEAVRDVSFTVPQGTVLGVLGPNGAGKTTTVRMLTTLAKPTAGTGRVLGLDVQRDATKVRASIGLAGQYAAVDENLTGRENLRLVGKLTHLSTQRTAERADALLEQFNLAKAGDRLVRTFSGGMRRRLDLAASLIVRPPLIFLDEPTTGLDPRTRGQMWGVIRNLVRDGSTVLLTTQYLDEADQLADRIAVIDRGRVVAEGTADELKASVGTASLHLRLGDSARERAALEVIEATLGTRGTVGSGAEITVPMADPDRVTDLLVAMRERGIHLTEMSVRKPTLDEVFLAITGHGVEPEIGSDEEAAA